MPRRCPDVSSPHLHRAETFGAAPLGKTDAGDGWLRVQLQQPGVLLLRYLGPRRAEGVAVAMFGPTGLDMLICNESVWSLSLCRWSRVLCDLGGLMFTCGLVR